MDDKNAKLLISAFTNALGIEEKMVTKDLKYQEIAQWDSITHMFLISEIENVFGIEINPDDILEMNSFPKVKEILTKYNLSF